VLSARWNQASPLVQLGLLDRAGLPVTGAEQAEKLLARAVPANGLLRPGSAED
jgi:carboxymethylenebutenolidase